MTDSAAILELRHARVAEQATLSTAHLSREPADDPTDDQTDDQTGVFVAIDEPPPVRTVLAVVQGDERRALQVTSVVEVAERDEHGTRGFYGRWVDDDALERAGKVGTEHLDDGTPVVQPVMPEHSVQINVSDAPGMAMPAPVLIVEDDTGVIAVGSRPFGSEYADGETASPEEAPDASESAPAADGDAYATDGETDQAAGEAREADSAEDGAYAAEDGAYAAEGDATAAEGDATAAEGDATTAEGEATAAEGDATSAEGEAYAAEGDAAATEGDANAAEGDANAAEGDANAEDGARRSSNGRRSRGRKKRKRR